MEENVSILACEGEHEPDSYSNYRHPSIRIAQGFVSCGGKSRPCQIFMFCLRSPFFSLSSFATKCSLFPWHSPYSIIVIYFIYLGYKAEVCTRKEKLSSFYAAHIMYDLAYTRLKISMINCFAILLRLMCEAWFVYDVWGFELIGTSWLIYAIR